MKRARTFGVVLLAAGVVAASLAGAPASAKKAPGTYKPPYKNGPSGGDHWNYVHRDRSTGEMGVFRTFPGFSPVVGCAPEPSAGWATFHVNHRVDRPVKWVAVRFEAALDPYAWITVGARGKRGEWLGVRKLQGPFAGERTLRTPLFDRPERGDRITIEFGIQLGDACPQASFGLAEFIKVKAKS